MEKYSTRICHLKSMPKFKVGDTVNPGDKIGDMGNTGQSESPHYHTDSALGWHDEHWRVSDCEKGNIATAPEQTDYLISFGIDEGFLHARPVITECYHSSRYTKLVGKRHWGTDVIGGKSCYWNRSFKAKVLWVGFDPGYGFSIILGYEV